MNLPDLSSVSDDAKNLAIMLDEMLERVVNIYNSYSMPVPERRYWTLGTPAVDCEQLVVSFIQMYIGSPGDEATQPRKCRDPRSATIQVQVSRQVPTATSTGRPPSAEDIEAFSVLQAYDAWVLLDAAADLDAWDQNGYGLGIIATVEVSEPQGGFQTAVMTLTTAVP
jgi:hypothetical protein